MSQNLKRLSDEVPNEELIKMIEVLCEKINTEGDNDHSNCENVSLNDFIICKQSHFNNQIKSKMYKNYDNSRKGQNIDANDEKILQDLFKRYEGESELIRDDINNSNQTFLNFNQITEPKISEPIERFLEFEKEIFLESDVKKIKVFL